jgi:hypothetical protein
MAESSIQLYDLLNDDEPHDLRTADEVRLTSTSLASSVDDSSGPPDLYGRNHERSEPFVEAGSTVNTPRSSLRSIRISHGDTTLASNPTTFGRRIPEPANLENDWQDSSKAKRKSPYLDVVSWWIPELISSALSVASFVSIVIVLLSYDRCAVARLGMPSGLTLNGIIALLATIGRVCLCAPICSALLQEMWLYFAKESSKQSPKSRLKDLELFFRASYGTTGSLEFLAHTSTTKSVIFHLLLG